MFFFFFQAEDGIRDADVTGVQTCALPIFALRMLTAVVVALTIIAGLDLLYQRHSWYQKQRMSVKELRDRSEERRVGKSVDLGGRRIIKKKKRQKRKQEHQSIEKKQIMIQ